MLFGRGDERLCCPPETCALLPVGGQRARCGIADSQGFELRL